MSVRLFVLLGMMLFFLACSSLSCSGYSSSLLLATRGWEQVNRSVRVTVPLVRRFIWVIKKAPTQALQLPPSWFPRIHWSRRGVWRLLCCLNRSGARKNALFCWYVVLVCFCCKHCTIVAFALIRLVCAAKTALRQCWVINSPGLCVTSDSRYFTALAQSHSVNALSKMRGIPHFMPELAQGYLSLWWQNDLWLFYYCITNFSRLTADLLVATLSFWV